MDQILTPDSAKSNEHATVEESGKSDPSRTALMEIEEYRKDGSTIWVELCTSVLRDANLQLDWNPVGDERYHQAQEGRRLGSFWLPRSNRPPR